MDLWHALCFLLRAVGNERIHPAQTFVLNVVKMADLTIGSFLG